MLPVFVLLAVAVAVALLLLFAPGSDGVVSPVAHLRAKELFLSKLTDAERRSWASDRRLRIAGSSGREYILMPYESFNIRAGKDAYCLSVLGRLPTYDKLLAQRLLLESDEQRFLAIANRQEFQPLS